MNFCEFCNVGEYNSMCFCTITNTMCGYVRKCSNEHRFKPLSRMADCLIKKGGNMSNKIRFVKNDKLYVEYKDGVITLDNVFGSDVPSGVKLITKGGDIFIEGFEPKEYIKPINNVKNTNKNKGKNGKK